MVDGTAHREPVLRAVECPPDKLPLNARKAVKLAMANGWVWEATYAIGYSLGHTDDGEEVHSVVVRARRRALRLAASWVSEKRGVEKMGFESAWVKYPGEIAVRLSSAELFENLMEPMATPLRPTS